MRADAGRRVGGTLLALALIAGCGEQGAAHLASAVPSRAPAGSGGLCAVTTQLTGLTVNRVTLAHSQVRFHFPARMAVRSPRRVQDVARALCALPPARLGGTACPNDFGVAYQLTFGPARLHLTVVRIEATGCGVVSGLGKPRRATTRMWRVLGTAMNLAGPNGNPVSALQGTLPWLA